MTRKKKSDVKQILLDAALKHAVFDGFSNVTLEHAANDAGIDKKELTELFPDGPASLVEAFSLRADAEMEQRLNKAKLETLPIREKIATAVRTRIAVIEPHKEAARRAAAFLSLPMHAALGARLIYRTVDSIWHAIGDTSTDFNYYTKRGVLSGLYSATLVRWFNDTSTDNKDTMDFLDARIENLMQLETLKTRVMEAAKKLPSLSEILGARTARR